MLTITKPNKARLDIELDGTLDADTMGNALDELIEKSKDIENGVMLYKIIEFNMPTFGAISVEFTRLPKLFGLLGKFNKCAVLCDTAWIRNAAEIEGALFPGIDIKAFHSFEVDEAETWLKET